MSERTFTDLDIHLALDDELPAEDRSAFEAWLGANPDKRAIYDRFADDRARLRAALAEVLAEPVPQHLRAMAATGGSGGRMRSLAWRTAAAAALLLAGGLGGYLAGIASQPGVPAVAKQVAERAIEAHVLYSAEKLHVVEVGADQQDHLVGWLSKRVGTTLVAPDFSSAGYQLVGGRLLPADAKAAAMFIYQDAGGARISLYVVRDSGAPDTGFQLREELGACAMYWLDGGYGYALTGSNMPGEKLQALAGSAYQQLLAAQRS